MAVPLVGDAAGSPWVMPRVLGWVMFRSSWDAAGWSPGCDGLARPARGLDGLPPSAGGRDDGVEYAEVVQPFGQARAAGQPVQPGDLIQEGPRLEGEEVVLPVADA